MARADNIIKTFPAFFQSEERGNTFYRFIAVFGQLLDEAETDLVKVLHAHWVLWADNEGSKGFDSLEKGDLDKIFSLYIENLGGTSLLRQTNRRGGEEGVADDEVYRRRMLSLIQVLRRGAATRQGIIDVVAANLGIFEDHPEAEAAKEQIGIIEYIPRIATYDFPAIDLFSQVQIDNLSPKPVAPDIVLEISEDFPIAILHPKIVNVTTGEAITFNKPIGPTDTIHVFPDGTALLRGVAEPYDGTLPLLPVGLSSWRIEGELGIPRGLFDEAQFDFALFEDQEDQAFGIFDESTFDSGAAFGHNRLPIRLSIGYEQLFPGSFRLNVPWDIPGFTVNYKIVTRTLNELKIHGLEPAVVQKLEPLIEAEFEHAEQFNQALSTVWSEQEISAHREDLLLFADYPDRFGRLEINPRNQIGYIVDKVKAGGIYAEVAFEKRFRERHAVQESLLPQLLHQESQDMQDGEFSASGSEGRREDQQMSDRFIASGVFDFTGFDTLNTFS